MCSGARRNGFVGRNFDFTYDSNPTVILHVNKTDKNKKFMGVTKSLFGKAIEPEKLPNVMLDGINEDGVCVTMNVVSKKDLDDFGPGFENVHGTNPGKKPVHMLCVPCMILAEASSAVDAVERLRNVNIYGDLLGIEHLHFFISDKGDRWSDNGDSYVVEVVGDKLRVLSFTSNINQDCDFIT